MRVRVRPEPYLLFVCFWPLAAIIDFRLQYGSKLVEIFLLIVLCAFSALNNDPSMSAGCQVNLGGRSSRVLWFQRYVRPRIALRGLPLVLNLPGGLPVSVFIVASCQVQISGRTEPISDEVERCCSLLLVAKRRPMVPWVGSSIPSCAGV